MQDNTKYAVAKITGDISAPNLNGTAYFYPFKDGVMIEIEVINLPGYKPYELFPIHIHDGKNCDLSLDGTFKNVLGHYNPTNEKHPYHAGDMPVLFSNSGYAYLKFYTTRFKLYDIIGKLVIIHEKIENESANTFGRKIGCGIIKEF